MKYVGPIGNVLLPLIFGLGLLLATAEDRELASLDFSHPTTLLKFVAGRVRVVQAYVRDLQVSHTLPAAAPRESTSRKSAPSPFSQ